MITVKKIWQHRFVKGECPTVDILHQYQQKLLSGSEVFEVEKHLTGCAMCNDILDGLNALSHPAALKAAELDIHQKIQQLLNTESFRKSPVFTLRKLAIAASLVVIAGLSFYDYQHHATVQKIIAQHQETVKPNTENDTRITAENQLPEFDKTHRLSTFKMPVTSIPKKQPVESISIITCTNPPSDMAPSSEFITDSMPVFHKNLAAITESERNDNKQIRCKTSISGNIIDKLTGEGLVGARVSVKNSMTGTISGADGKFTIIVPDSFSTLAVNYIGYINEEINPYTKKDISIAMQPDISKLDEVVVVGYGTTKKADLHKNLNGYISGNTTEKEQHALNENNGLNKPKFSTPQDSALQKLSGIETCIRLKEKVKAITLLNSFKTQTSDPAIRLKTDTIIDLLTKNKYKKALEILKKLR